MRLDAEGIGQSMVIAMRDFPVKTPVHAVLQPILLQRKIGNVHGIV
jgi:hypothetical protein